MFLYYLCCYLLIGRFLLFVYWLPACLFCLALLLVVVCNVCLLFAVRCYAWCFGFVGLRSGVLLSGAMHCCFKFDVVCSLGFDLYLLMDVMFYKWC